MAPTGSSKIKSMRATQKQKKAFINAVENGGNISRAMIDAKYSPATAKTPQKLTESKGWEELKREFLPDELLLKVHLEGLKANRTSFSGEEVPDYKTRHQYLDSGYKVKGSYAPDKTVNLNIEVDANEEIKELTKKLNDLYRGADK